jgi:dCMP deaminase
MTQAAAAIMLQSPSGNQNESQVRMHLQDLEKWDKRFLELARHISTWSKNPSTQVGCVIADKRRRVISVGFDGLAQGVQDLPERLHNREIKYKMGLHAERNAIIFAGHRLDDCTMYIWPFMSCAACAAMAIQAGITREVAPFNENPRWVHEFELAKIQFQEAKVELVLVEGMDIPAP